MTDDKSDYTNFHCTGYYFNWKKRPLIFSVINTTPDSFYQASRAKSISSILKTVEWDIAHGADIIDIGGESTRPGSLPVPVQEQLRRTLPAIEAIKKEFDIPVSIDTTRYEVLKTAVEHGVDIINDTSGFTVEGEKKLLLAAHHRLGVIIMHRRGIPRTMQEKVHYHHCVNEIRKFFQKQVDFALQHGVPPESLILDPGIGFGKLVENNLCLIDNIDKLSLRKYPVMLGLSRKSFIGTILHNETNERLIGSIVSATVALQNGVAALRVHDVHESYEAVQMVQALKKKKKPPQLFASVDIGSNTCRLLIAENKKGKIIPHFETQRILRLNENIDKTGEIASEAVERLLSLLRCYKAYICKFHCDHESKQRITGTAVFRDAQNSNDIQKRIREETGLNLTILSEQEEASTASSGMLSALDHKESRGKQLLLFDIGGGSTEITLIEEKRSRRVLSSVSLSIGAVKLCNRFPEVNKGKKQALIALQEAVGRELAENIIPEKPETSLLCIGTAGTITTLAALKLQMRWYSSEKINNTVLTLYEIDDLIAFLLTLTEEERTELPQLEKGRSDLIIPGATIVRTLMLHYRINEIIVIDSGMREGNMVQLFKDNQNFSI